MTTYTDSNEDNQQIINNTGKTVSLISISMCILAAIFYCYEYYLRVAPSIMSVELKDAFNISDAGLGHLSACFYYPYVLIQVPVGVMMDRYGPRIILSLSCTLCALGTYLFTLHDLPHAFYIAQFGRMLIGLGSAFAYVGVLKITVAWLPDRYFAFMAGIATALGMVGAMSGEMFMAYSVEIIGWVNTLQKAAIAGTIITILIWLGLRDKPNQATDVVAAGPHMPMQVALSRLITKPQIWIVGIIGCLMYLPISVFAEMWAVPYFQTNGFIKDDAAKLASIMFLGFGIGCPLWGIFSDYIKSRRKIIIISSLLSALTIGTLLYYNYTTNIHSVHVIYPLMFLFGAGIGGEIMVFAIANDISPMSLSGTAVALTNMLVMTSGALLQPLVGKILTLMENTTSIVDSYTIALLVLPIGLIISNILACLFLKESYS